MLNSAAEVTNNADFDLEIRATDEDSKELIDFTGASIAVSVRDERGGELLRATTDDGTVTVIDIGIIGVNFTPDQMKRLCPATYRIGAVYELNDKRYSIFIGDFTLVDGVAFL